MPQFHELQRRRHLQRGVINVAIIQGEETLVIDQRSRCSMAMLVEDKLNRLQNPVIPYRSQQKSSKN